MACLCNSVYGPCRTACEPLWATLRCVENLPIVGHILASFYACCGQKDKAERSAIKATIGFVGAILNFPAEMWDEIVRNRSKKIYSYALTPRTDWMKKYHRRTLRNLCMPASHQSGTYNMDRKLKPVPLVEGWSQCQALNIETQLTGGIRFLDLRLMTDDKTKEIWLHHNIVCCIKFKDVLAIVRDFVVENRSEIIQLYITNDGKPLDWGKVNGLIGEYLGTKLIPDHMKSMAIGDMIEYGKNVVIYGVPDVAYSWRGLDNRWPNKAWPHDLALDMSNTMSDLQLYNPHFLFWYKAECTPNAAMVVRSIGGFPGACAAKCADEKFEFIEGMAASTNNKILDILTDVSYMPFNVLSTDYVHDDIIQRIIDMNENEETGAGPASRQVSTLSSRPTSEQPSEQAATAHAHPTSRLLSASATGDLQEVVIEDGVRDTPPSSPNRLEAWETSM